MSFVKSANTSTTVARSQAEVERILRRYGASGFGTQSDYERHTVKVHFRVPDSGANAAHVPVRLELDIAAVAKVMFGEKLGRKRRRWTRNGYVTKDGADQYAQAERVAWRHLVLWIDAACAAAAAGMQTMSEAFFAHILTKGEDGTVRRMIEHLQVAAGENWRALLPPGSS